MVDDSQVDILNNWNESEETEKKKRIRESLGTNLIELRHFLKMSPQEAQDAVQSAIDNHVEKEYPPTSDRTEIEKELARQLISTLFNGFSEEAFNYGFNAGVNYTLEWRTSFGDLHASWLKDNLSSSKSINIFEMESGPYKKEYQSPPDSERERRKRILLLENKKSVLASGMLEKILEMNLDSIKPDPKYEPIVERDDSPTRDDFRPVQEFFHAIKIGRYRARKMSFKINNPNNLSVDLPPSWYVRETIELHRTYLEEQGQLPDEDDLPEYGDPERGVRNPAKLNLYEWTEPTISDRS